MLDVNEAALQAASVALQLAAVRADVADERELEVAISAAAASLGRLDGVVNCAGIDLLKPFDQMDSAEWRRVMQINLDGPMQVCRAALPALRQAGRGTIVNLASGAGLRPLEHRTAYYSAKAALVMFSRALAMDLAENEIR